ncbi:MAG TPA: SRPBCC family protein [Flavisolibacter sp.]
MAVIHVETFIKAPVEIVFDLSRSVDLHKSSMAHHKEEIIAGVSKGLIQKGDTVTWQARHLFRTRKLKVGITELTAPTFFADEMLEGDFRKMRHEHYFKSLKGGTIIVDHFCFESPFGILGKLVNIIFLKKYMTRLLLERNKEIKRIAETDLWKQYLT